MTIGIYKITSPSTRIYVGQSVNIERRFKVYKEFDNCKGQRILYNSFKKHGSKNHKFTILKECDVEELNKWERFFQIFYINCGYEMGDGMMNLKVTMDGDKSGFLSEETKNKIKSHAPIIQRFCLNGDFIKEGIMKDFIDDGFLRGNVAMCVRGLRSHHKGYVFKSKFHDNFKWPEKFFIPRNVIEQYDLKGNIIKAGQLKEFIKDNFNQSKISKCCRGEIAQHKSFVFKYKNDKNFVFPDKFKIKNRIIEQYGVDKKLIKSGYLNEFVREGFESGQIASTCNGKQSNYKNFIFKYKDDESFKWPEKITRVGKIIKQFDKKRKFIKQGIVDDFLKEGFTRNGISKCCLGKAKSHNDFVFRYKE